MEGENMSKQLNSGRCAKGLSRQDDRERDCADSCEN